MIYIEESFQFKKMRKFGKEEMRIVKDYRNLEVCVKEREGCRKPVADPDMVGEIEGQPVGTRYMDRMSALEAGVHGSLRRGIYSYKGSPRSVVFQMGTKSLYNKDKGNRIRFGEGGRSKDGTMQVKDQVYTHGNRALQNAMQSGQSVHVIRGYRLHSKYAPNNGFRYDGLYKVMACYQKRDKNGYKIILFKLERLPDQLSIGTRGKFWVYLPMPEPAKVSEPSAPMQSLFSTRPELPSFNKFKTSSYTLPANWQQVALNQSCPTHLNSDSGAPLSPVPPVKVKNYCDGTLRYPAKVESTVIAAIPLLQYPEVDIKVGAQSPPPFSLFDRGPQKSKSSNMEDCEGWHFNIFTTPMFTFYGCLLFRLLQAYDSPFSPPMLINLQDTACRVVHNVLPLLLHRHNTFALMNLH
ncbi:PUA-like domain-containing protein [Armillaria nabsnona]|nr:PUA-like domain-containing protein [Armillaria nabsnona]